MSFVSVLCSYLTIYQQTLYLKNIAPSVSQEQLSLLFAQFTLANGGPVDVRLMSGRMRGQAFVIFHSEYNVLSHKILFTKEPILKMTNLKKLPTVEKALSFFNRVIK